MPMPVSTDLAKALLAKADPKLTKALGRDRKLPDQSRGLTR